MSCYADDVYSQCPLPWPDQGCRDDPRNYGSQSISVVVVDIKQDSFVITDQMKNTVVGKQVSLTGEVTGGTPTYHTWSIPSYCVKNYVHTLTTGAPVSLDPTDLHSSGVSYYWVDGGNKPVTYSATVGGRVFTASTNFSVARPTAEVKTKTGTVGLYNLTGGLMLSYGNPTTRGIEFTRTWSEPAGYTEGCVKWVQVINSTLIRRQANGGNWGSIQGAGLLDTQYPYEAGDSTEDSPYCGALTNSHSKYERSDSFSMYLMYAPSGGIDVPLIKVDWSWSGNATRTGSQWTLDSSSNIPSNSTPTVSGSDCTSFPLWSGNTSGLQW